MILSKENQNNNSLSSRKFLITRIPVTDQEQTLNFLTDQPFDNTEMRDYYLKFNENQARTYFLAFKYTQTDENSLECPLVKDNYYLKLSHGSLGPNEKIILFKLPIPVFAREAIESYYNFLSIVTDLDHYKYERLLKLEFNHSYKVQYGRETPIDLKFFNQIFPRQIDYKERFEIPEEVISTGKADLFAKSILALSYLREQVAGQGLDENFFPIACGLYEEFGQEVAKQVLWGKITTQLQRKLLFNLLDDQVRYGHITFLFKFAAEKGWSKAETSNLFGEESNRIFKPAFRRITKFHLPYVSMYYGKNEIGSKVTILQSQQGTGKTHALLNMKNVQKVLYISHRKTLVYQCFKTFQKVMGSGSHYEKLSNAELENCEDSLFICVNSLDKISIEKYRGATVIIDEVDQVVSTIYGDNFKNQKDRVLAKLARLIDVSKNTFLVSADIPDSLFYYLEECIGIKEYEHLINGFSNHRSKKLYLYPSKEQLLDTIEQGIRNGSKIATGFSTKKTLGDVGQRIKQKFPDRKLLAVTSEEKGNIQVSEVLEDFSKIQEYDILLFTSVFGSGVDFNFDFCEDIYLVIDTEKTLSHWEVGQLMQRFRRAKSFHVFVVSRMNSNSDPQPISFENILDQALEQKKKKISHLAEFEWDDGNSTRKETVIELNKFEVHRALVEYERKFSSDNLSGLFIQLCRERGMEVISIKKDAGLVQKTTANPVQEKKDLNVETASLTLAARDIDLDEARSIKFKGYSNDEEKYALRKFNYKSLIGYKTNDKNSERDLKYALDNWPNPERLHDALVFFSIRPSEMLYVWEELGRKLEKYRGQLASFVDLFPARKAICDEMASYMVYGKRYTIKDLQVFSDYVRGNKAFIESTLSISIANDLKSPESVTKALLRKFGMRLSKVLKPDNQIYYQIKRQDWIFMNRSSRRIRGDLRSYVVKIGIPL